MRAQEPPGCRHFFCLCRQPLHVSSVTGQAWRRHTSGLSFGGAWQDFVCLSAATFPPSSTRGPLGHLPVASRLLHQELVWNGWEMRRLQSRLSRCQEITRRECSEPRARADPGKQSDNNTECLGDRGETRHLFGNRSPPSLPRPS